MARRAWHSNWPSDVPIRHARTSGIANDPTRPQLVGGEDWDSDHVGYYTSEAEEFTAAGGAPEAFVLGNVPTGTVRVYLNGVRIPDVDWSIVSDEVSVDTTAGDIVTVDYGLDLEMTNFASVVIGAKLYAYQNFR